jgi:hypothetical protein
MPSHIFSTPGMWQDAIQADLASNAAANVLGTSFIATTGSCIP